MVSVARSRGMHFHFFIQSLAQLNNVYRKEVAKIILDNSGLAYLKTNTMETAEEVSKRLEKKTINSNSISQSMSILKYDGNKTQSLMARELLTPDEVKNLHHKTIIFPNIGYPILRDTVTYKKLSCYSSGKLERRAIPLMDLSNTYFTAENLKIEYNRKCQNNKSINQQDFFEYVQFKEMEKSKLKNVVELVQTLLKSKISLFEYKENNNRIFASFELKKPLNVKELTFIKGKVNKDIFYLKIDDNSTKPIIEIHLKNPLEQDLNFGKEIANNV